MTVDFAIIGAGPAGMAAAALAAELGLDTLLVDEQDAPGGQIYRGIERAPESSPLGTDYLAGRELATALRGSTARYRPATTVWHIDPDGTLSLVVDGKSETVAARHILLATGAIERPVAIPGWTLPGVMTVGAAQILLKTADLVPEGRAVLAGQGPLLALVALQLGRERLERVVWDGGEIAADHLFLHEGVIPNTQISLALQLAHRWDDSQLCWRPVVDDWGRTSLARIAIAGDGGGIAGAGAAALSGRLAALDAAAALGRIGEAERDRRAVPLRAGLARERAIRPFLDALYRPADSVLSPADEVIACRCEEVSAGQIRQAVRLGATGPNQIKAFLRCGMGPCQGRVCGPIVGAVIAQARALPIAEIGNYRPRAPYKPITLGTLAG